MARDRKRAKQRQRRAARSGARPAAGSTPPASPSVPGALGGLSDAAPLPEAEPADDLARAAVGGSDAPADEPSAPGAEVFEDELDPAAGAPDEEQFAPSAGSSDTLRARPAGAGRERRGGNRVFTFLRHSWEELQRVQWPDRKAVVQATSVVLGFVVLAGAYLGLMDAVFAKLVNKILSI